MAAVSPKLLPLVAEWGCGNVLPRRDRARARCGGPVFCDLCALDLAFVHMVEDGQGDADLEIITRKEAWLRLMWHRYLHPLREPDVLEALRQGRIADYVLRIRPGLW